MVPFSIESQTNKSLFNFIFHSITPQRVGPSEKMPSQIACHMSEIYYPICSCFSPIFLKYFNYKPREGKFHKDLKFIYIMTWKLLLIERSVLIVFPTKVSKQQIQITQHLLNNGTCRPHARKAHMHHFLCLSNSKSHYLDSLGHYLAIAGFLIHKVECSSEAGR